eukprot:122184_1
MSPSHDDKGRLVGILQNLPTPEPRTNTQDEKTTNDAEESADSCVSSQHMRHNADFSRIKTLCIDVNILEEKDSEEEDETEEDTPYGGGSMLIHEDLELDDKQEIEEYEAYIKKHNKRKKKKRKTKKKKKRKSEKQQLHRMSPIFVDQSRSQDLWDLHDIHVHALKEVRMQEEKEKKKRKAKEKKRKLKKRRSQKLLKMSPKERKEFKEIANLSKNGFKIVVNRRYKLDDGRIGVCKFRGRTVFGKTGQDWIGIMVEHGYGEHNGTVDGVKYFLCKEGKGIMVRPKHIVKDLGSSKKEPIYSPVGNPKFKF